MTHDIGREPGHLSELSQDLERKRSILLSTRIRFSPNAQSLRDAAIERIVELVLLLKGSEPLSLPAITAEMQGGLGGGLATVSEADVRRALGKLVGEGAVVGQGEGHQKRTYELSEERRSSIQALEDEASHRLDRIVAAIFKNARPSHEEYLAPFIECVRRVFLRLADSYVRLLKGDIDPSEFAAHETVRTAISDVVSVFPRIQLVDFEQGMIRFLLETDPEFDAVKWNMTQNFYLLTVLGIDSGGYLLSEDVFGGASFYLDTNVVIAALLTRARFHSEYAKLAAAFHSLGITIRVCQITLDELRLVVDYERSGIQMAAAQVPPDTEVRVSDRFLHAFREAERRGDADPLSAVFRPFEDPIAGLSQMADTELVDDNWFDDAKSDVHTGDLVVELQRVAESLHPNRPKKDRAAEHDALLLRWLERVRENDTPNTWVLTLDGSLCAFEADARRGTSIHRNLALTLDAVLLWLAPVVGQGGVVGEDLADIFADALRNQLLPKEKLFDLRDFMIFAEIGWECRELPAEDVEECIRYIRRDLAHLDPSNAEDRERLIAAINRFFVDPSRKHLAVVQGLEDEIAALRAALDESAERQRREFEEQVGRVTSERDQSLATMNASLEKVSDELGAEKRARAADALKASARWRLGLALLLLLGIQGLLVLFTNDQGTGDTSLQRIVSMWPLHAFAFAGWLLLAGWVIGRRRAAALGWPFDRIREPEANESTGTRE